MADTISSDSVAEDQLRAFVARISEPGDRLAYVLDRIEPCRGISPYSMNRAFSLAAQIFGVDYDIGKLICRLGWHGMVDDAAIRIGTLPADVVGQVYLVRASGWPDRIKVGFSTQLDIRVEQLCRQYGRTISVIHTFVGTMLDEHAIHCDRRAARLDGEWFRVRAA